MKQFRPYRLHIQADPDGGFVVTSPDVPELVTQGEMQKESLANAREALLVALSGYMRLFIGVERTV